LADESKATSKQSAEASAPRERPETARARIVELAIGGAWLVGLAAVLAITDGLLKSVPIARGLVGALIASIGVGRAHVVWDELDPTDESIARPAKLAARGAMRGATAAFAALVVASAFGWATIKLGQIGIGLVLGLVSAGATSVREELLFRALPMHFATRAGVDRRWAVGFATLLSPTPFLLVGHPTPAAIALSLSYGFLAARALDRMRSAWPAVAASFVARAALGPAMQAGVMSISWTSGEATLGGLATGAPAWVAAAIAVLVGLFGMPRRVPSPPVA
jgi:hypothetical protein